MSDSPAELESAEVRVAASTMSTASQGEALKSRMRRLVTSHYLIAGMVTAALAVGLQRQAASAILPRGSWKPYKRAENSPDAAAIARRRHGGSEVQPSCVFARHTAAGDTAAAGKLVKPTMADDQGGRQSLGG